ncbi:MAG TPA: NADP-dependent malic enzyme [Spirochaetota bacterium]|nr:NADP-dependent malic enzyme [Spirochaetota bacterium]
MKYDEKELLAKAKRPGEVASKLHRLYQGKIEVLPRCRVKKLSDFNVWYTPGVAATCREIQKNRELVYEYTCKWNTVAVISDGTRVLGLGDIGPEAAMPVMEGKSLLFKYLGDVDAFPLCLDTKDPERFIETVKILQPSLGGVNLEDISQPKCFYILDRLRKECSIPVWHDDQQGTAAVIVAGLMNAVKVKKEWISRMANNSIVFVCANPVPEIWPWEAKEAGARVVATGRSDFPNQVNNSLGFPGIFRGTLDVRARTITDEMCIEAARELAKTAEDRGLRDDYIIPTMDEWEVFPREAAAVGMKAIEQGIALQPLEKDELYRRAESIIRTAREKTKMLFEKGFITDHDEDF